MRYSWARREPLSSTQRARKRQSKLHRAERSKSVEWKSISFFSHYVYFKIKKETFGMSRHREIDLLTGWMRSRKHANVTLKMWCTDASMQMSKYQNKIISRLIYEYLCVFGRGSKFGTTECTATNISDQNFKITNIKIKKNELFDSFIFELIFLLFINYFHNLIAIQIVKYWFSK